MTAYINQSPHNQFNYILFLFVQPQQQQQKKKERAREREVLSCIVVGSEKCFRQQNQANKQTDEIEDENQCARFIFNEKTGASYQKP